MKSIFLTAALYLSFVATPKGALAQISEAWQLKVPNFTEAHAGSGFFVFGQNDKIWTIYDAKSGKNVLRFDKCEDIRIQGDVAMVALTSKAEIWNLRTKKRESTIPKGRIALGAVIDKSFFYIQGKTLYRWDLTAGTVTDHREVGESYGKWPVHTDGRLVLVDPSQHEVLGLDPGDLSKGWKSYCDSYIGGIYEDYILLFSKLGFSLGMLDKQGKLSTLPAMNEGSMQAIRQPPARIGNTVAQGGMWVKPGPSLVSPYFFAADIHSGKLLWKRPMVGTLPIAIAGKFAVIESHGPWGIYTGGIHSMRSQIVVIDPIDGKTLFKVGREFRTKHDDGSNPSLVATENMLCVARGGSATVYRVR